MEQAKATPESGLSRKERRELKRVKFRCAEGLVDRLAEFVRAYPDFVYVAPYPDMDVKIAVTRLGKILVLDEVDPARIRVFVEG